MRNTTNNLFVSNHNVITALPTPYLANGQIDVESYVKLCQYQQQNGVTALLCLGTTAETQLLSKSERTTLVELTRKSTSLPLIVGIEEPCTAVAVRQAERYAFLGADGLLIAPPSFCKCTSEGYIRHVTAIQNASGLPIVLYNIPSRSGYALDTEAVRQLSKTVRYVKDSSPNMQFTDTVKDCINVLCGSDEMLTTYLQHGAIGVISVASNVAPKLTIQAVNGQNTDLFHRLAVLCMQQINPIAIKYLLYKTGIFATYDVRLPLTRADETTRKNIEEFLERYGKTVIY